MIPIPGGGSATPGPFGVTALFHLVGYAALAYLLVLQLRGRGESGSAVLIAPIVVATGYGAGIELLQAAIPWRSFAYVDVFVNAVGATIGAVVGDRRTPF